jgi:hypothetical protein
MVDEFSFTDYADILHTPLVLMTIKYRLLVDYPFLYNLLDMGIELKGLASQKQQSE